MSEFWDKIKAIRVDVPDGRSGEWKIKKKSTKVSPGYYTELSNSISSVMTDKLSEVIEHWHLMQEIRGHVLMSGLGLGWVLEAGFATGRVDRFTVIEKNKDVIKLVAPHYLKKIGDKLEIIHADIMTWEPPEGVHYNIVWHDFEDGHTVYLYTDMETLHERYKNISDWQASWHPEIVAARMYTQRNNPHKR